MITVALTYVFSLHYTGRVSASEFIAVGGLNAIFVGSIAGERRTAGTRSLRPRNDDDRLRQVQRSEGDALVQGSEQNVPGAGLQESGAALRRHARGGARRRPRHAGVLLPRQQPGQSVEAEQEGRSRKRQAARSGGRELSESRRTAFEVGQS